MGNPRATPLRVLFDANLLVSFLVNSNPSRSAVAALFVEAEARSFTLLVPIEAFEEAARVISEKPWLSARFTIADVARLRDYLHPIIEHIPALDEPPPGVCRDPRDDYLLAQGIRNGVDIIVTRDNDLLALGILEDVRILDPVALLALLRSSRWEIR